MVTGGKADENTGVGQDVPLVLGELANDKNDKM